MSFILRLKNESIVKPAFHAAQSEELIVAGGYYTLIPSRRKPENEYMSKENRNVSLT